MKLNRPLAWMACLLLPLAATTVHALTLSPSSLTLAVGQTGTVALTSISGTPAVTQNTAPSVATATLSGSQVQIKGIAPGQTTVTVRDAKETKSATITVRAPMAVTPTALSLSVGQSGKITISNASGEIRISNSNSTVASTSLSSNVLTATGRAAGTAKLTIRDNVTTVEVAVTVLSGAVTATEPHPGRVLASNCFQCHGTNGSGGFDKLRGEGRDSLLSELRKFASGAEDPTGIMAAHAMGYTDEQLQLIADFFSKQ
jgi:sulfide dehydrogenase cytochrome subunit